MQGRRSVDDQSSRSAPSFSPAALELLRILRITEAGPGRSLRAAALRALWMRHAPRPWAGRLDAATAELLQAKRLAEAKPDGVLVLDSSLR